MTVMCNLYIQNASKSRSRSLGLLNHIKQKKPCLFNSNNNYYEINYKSCEVYESVWGEKCESFFFLFVPFSLSLLLLQGIEKQKIFLTFGLLLSCCVLSDSRFLLRCGTRPENSCRFSLAAM